MSEPHRVGEQEYRFKSPAIRKALLNLDALAAEVANLAAEGMIDSERAARMQYNIYRTTQIISGHAAKDTQKK